MGRKYREVPHTADVALEVWGRDLPQLFANAAEGLFGLATSVEPEAPLSGVREVRLSAPDPETLFVDWLNELLLLADENGEAYVAFEVSFPRSGELVARVSATRAFAPQKTIKAATFHGLAIEGGAGGYHTLVVFDV